MVERESVDKNLTFHPHISEASSKIVVYYNIYILKGVEKR